MLIKRISWGLSLAWSILTWPGQPEYLYPVGYNPVTQQIYLLYQISQQELKLWAWEPSSQVAYPTTLSCFNPACFQCLPDYTGFSFISQGLLRVKEYHKRLVRTIELFAPCTNLNSIIWVDSSHFYCCAKQAQDYALFLVDISTRTPQLQVVCQQPGYDYLFPQIYADKLYCLERSGSHTSLVRTNLNQAPQLPVQLLNFADRALKFLHIVNDHLAFCLEQLPAQQPDLVSFACLKLVGPSVASAWQSQTLFTFHLPLVLFSNQPDNPMRVYESILPFLPKYTSKKIYFCTQSADLLAAVDLRVNLFSYDLNNAHVKQLTHAQEQQLFCGLIITADGRAYYGGSTLAATMTLDDIWGLPKIVLPELKTD